MRRVEVGGARGSCVQDSVFELWEAAGQEVDGIEDYHAALQQLPFGYSELAGALLAGTRYDAAGALTSAHGLLVSFAASDGASSGYADDAKRLVTLCSRLLRLSHTFFWASTRTLSNGVGDGGVDVFVFVVF